MSRHSTSSRGNTLPVSKRAYTPMDKHPPISISKRTRARLVYMAVLLGLFLLTWTYGGRMMYVALYTLLLMPCLSYLLTFLLLKGLRVTQQTGPTTIIKGETGLYTVFIRNFTPLMYDDIRCRFADDHFAVESDSRIGSVSARPFMNEQHTVTFRVKYRGVYPLGLRALEVNDLTGLFTLKRSLKSAFTLTVLPRVTELDYFPLAAHLMSQAHSNYEIKEEDYATVSDIRPYVPTDSIKRVHWKLTAKRSEWMVKNFQSNALNRITLLFDASRRVMPHEEALPLEDRMIETTLALIHYCLLRQMPTAFVTGGGVRKECRSLGDFESIYPMAAAISFEALSPLSIGTQPSAQALTLLNQCLNESASYINVVIVTAQLDAALYDRVVNANHNGHFAAVYYFTSAKPDPASEEIFRMLSDGGIPCQRVTAE